MNGAPARGRFRPQLAQWALRGAFCAAPSYLWAVFGGAGHAAGHTAMLAGVATYVLAFAWLASLPACAGQAGPGSFGWALRRAAILRIALTPFMALGPDMWLGVIAVGCFHGGSESAGAAAIAARDAWLPIYAITLVQGALVSATLLLLALGVQAARALWPGLRPDNRVAIGASGANVGPDGPV